MSAGVLVSICNSVKRVGTNWSHSLNKFFTVGFLSPEPLSLLLQTADDEYIPAVDLLRIKADIMGVSTLQ